MKQNKSKKKENGSRKNWLKETISTSASNEGKQRQWPTRAGMAGATGGGEDNVNPTKYCY